MMTKLKPLGHKICIIGPSCSGKSTLSVRLAEHLALPLYHLDLLAHKPNTDWECVSDQEFIQSHDQVVESESWIIEGNYYHTMRQRFLHADTVICLQFNRFSCALRYLQRSWLNDPLRPGKLPGSKVEFRWWLLRHIIFVQPKNRLKYHALMKEVGVRNVVVIKSNRDLKKHASRWFQHGEKGQ